MKLRMVLVLSVLGAGCSGSRSDELNNNLGTGGRDGEVGEDGAVVDAAEGELDADSADAGPDPDAAAPDAAAPDAAVLTGFRLSLNSLGKPLAGRTVLLHSADGAILAQRVTDAEGSVFSEDAPAMATVQLATQQYEYNYFSQLLTFTGTKAGDHIVVAVVEENTLTERTLYNAQLMDPWPGSSNYVTAGTSGNCAAGYLSEGAPTPTIVRMYASCALPPLNNTMLATGYESDSSPPVPQGFAVAHNVAGPALEAIDVPFGAWLPVSPVSVRMVGEIPQPTGLVQADLAMLIDGQRFDIDDIGGNYPAPANFRVASEIVSGLEARAGFLGSGTGDVRHRLMRSGPSQAEITFNTAEALPQVSTVSLDDTSPLRPVFGFTAPSTLDRVDAVYSVLEFRYDGLLRWGFVSPPEQRTITVPALPAALSAAAGIDNAASSVYSVTLLGSDALSGYDAFRARPFKPVQDSEPPEMVLWTLDSGESAQLSTWYQSGI